MALNPGDVFAGYTIRAELGRGGMGTVYLASHPRLPRQDALKLLSGHLSTDDKFRARFEREADLAARLFHRNIVAVHDRGSEDGQLWISMQFVDGSDTTQALRLAGGGGLDPGRVVRIISEVGAALDFAHRRQMLHRDVKPANILLSPPEEGSDDEEAVLLSDFGIAKLVNESQNLTGTGNLLATLAYASPEQIEGKPIDHRVDIYSLGCVLFELLTGSVPFPNENAFATMRAHLSEPPPAPSNHRPELAGFDGVVAKAMAKDPADRYQTCRQLAQAATAALATVTDPGPGDSAAARPTTVLDLAGPVAPSPGSGNQRSGQRGSEQRGSRQHGSEQQLAGQQLAGQHQSALHGSGQQLAGPHGSKQQGSEQQGSEQQLAGQQGSGQEWSEQRGSRQDLDSGSQPGYSEPITASRPPYVIRVLRSGPLDPAPSALLGEVRTTVLQQEDRIAVEELIYQMRFFELPDQLPQQELVSGDIFEQISVASAYQRHTVGYYRAGSARPPELDRLVAVLERCAAWQQTSWQPSGNPADHIVGNGGAGTENDQFRRADLQSGDASQPRETGPVPTGPPHLGSVPSGLSRFEASQSGPSQFGTPQLGPSQLGPSQSGPSQLGPSQSWEVPTGVQYGGSGQPWQETTGPTQLAYPGADEPTRQAPQNRLSQHQLSQHQGYQHQGSQHQARQYERAQYQGHRDSGSQSRVTEHAFASSSAPRNDHQKSATEPASTSDRPHGKMIVPLIGAATVVVVVIAVGVYLLTRGGTSATSAAPGASIATESQTTNVAEADTAATPTADPAAAAGAIASATEAGGPNAITASLDNNVTYLDLEQPGSTGRVSFEGKAGDRAFVNVPESTLADDCEPLSIRTDSDQILGGGCIFGGTGFVDGVVLPYDGEYFIVIDPSDDTTGGNLTVELFISQDQNEAIEADGSSFTANIPVPGARSDFTFSGVSGQRVFVSMPSSNFADDCDILSVRDSSNEILATGCTFSGLGLVDTTELPSDGEYHLVVDPTGTSTGTGDIKLTTATLTSQPIAIDGPPVTSILSNPGDAEELTFSATAGQLIFVAITKSASSYDCDLVKLRDSNQNDLASGCVLDGTGFLDTFEIPADGDYIIDVNPQDSSVGNVDISLTSATRTDGEIQVNGGPQTAAMPKPGDFSVFTFDAAQGQQVSITVSGSTLADQCSLPIILDAGGNELDSECIYGGESSIPELTLPTDGKYSIVINPEGSGVGSAIITLTS